MPKAVLKLTLAFCLTIAGASALTACSEEEGSAEKAGKKMDKFFKDAGEAISEATEEAKEELEEAAEKTKDAFEDATD